MGSTGAPCENLGAGLGGLDGAAVYTLGEYWHPDRDERTGIGELVHRAKDRHDPKAAMELAERFACLAGILPAVDLRPAAARPRQAERFACLAGVLPVVDGDSPRLVAPVPSGPSADGDEDRPRLAELLAASLAVPRVGEYRPNLLARTNPTPRLRHVAPERRAEVVASAGLMVCEPVAGRHVVLVDDVMLTGTTLGAVAACLQEAGAASVTAVVAARTRLR